MNNHQGYRNWREKLNFYAFAVTLLDYGDMYSPDSLSRPLSTRHVVNGWKQTVSLIKAGRAPTQLGMVIFIPFCKVRCFFCPFPSERLLRRSQLDVFTDSLLQEMANFKEVFKGVNFNTLLLVGGTPSILEARHFRKIFKSLHNLFSFSKDAQIAAECSVSSSSYEKFKLLHSLNVQRVTIGVQSLNKRVLKNINRLFQSRSESLQIIRQAKRAGIKTVNVDLMCGLPGDSLDSFRSSLKDILLLRPEMIHINPFILSPDTIFLKKKLIYSKKDILRRFRQAEIGKELLKKAGYQRADGALLGFKRLDVKGAENQQELDRMKHDASYIGFGGMVTSHAFSSLQYTNIGFEKEWSKITLPKYFGRDFDIKEEMRFYIIMNMRRTISRKEFKAIFGRDIASSFNNELQELKNHDLVFIDEERLFFKIKTRQEHVILSKHFYNPKILEGLEKKHRVRFDAGKNYLAEVARSLDITI